MAGQGDTLLLLLAASNPKLYHTWKPIVAPPWQPVTGPAHFIRVAPCGTTPAPVHEHTLMEPVTQPEKGGGGWSTALESFHHKQQQQKQEQQQKQQQQTDVWQRQQRSSPGTPGPTLVEPCMANTEASSLAGYRRRSDGKPKRSVDWAGLLVSDRLRSNPQSYAASTEGDLTADDIADADEASDAAGRVASEAGGSCGSDTSKDASASRSRTRADSLTSKWSVAPCRADSSQFAPAPLLSSFSDCTNVALLPLPQPGSPHHRAASLRAHIEGPPPVPQPRRPVVVLEVRAPQRAAAGTSSSSSSGGGPQADAGAPASASAPLLRVVAGGPEPSQLPRMHRGLYDASDWMMTRLRDSAYPQPEAELKAEMALEYEAKNQDVSKVSRPFPERLILVKGCGIRPAQVAMGEEAHDEECAEASGCLQVSPTAEEEPDGISLVHPTQPALDDLSWGLGACSKNSFPARNLLWRQRQASRLDPLLLSAPPVDPAVLKAAAAAATAGLRLPASSIPILRAPVPVHGIPVARPGVPAPSTLKAASTAPPPGAQADPIMTLGSAFKHDGANYLLSRLLVVPGSTAAAVGPAGSAGSGTSLRPRGQRMATRLASSLRELYVSGTSSSSHSQQPQQQQHEPDLSCKTLQPHQLPDATELIHPLTTSDPGSVAAAAAAAGFSFYLPRALPAPSPRISVLDATLPSTLAAPASTLHRHQLLLQGIMADRGSAAAPTPPAPAGPAPVPRGRSQYTSSWLPLLHPPSSPAPYSSPQQHQPLLLLPDAPSPTSQRRAASVAMAVAMAGRDTWRPRQGSSSLGGTAINAPAVDEGASTSSVPLPHVLVGGPWAPLESADPVDPPDPVHLPDPRVQAGGPWPLNPGPSAPQGTAVEGCPLAALV